MSNCPYCNGAHLSPTDKVTRSRPETQAVVQCSSCMSFALKHQNGRIFPLIDRTDPDQDACTRVMDG